MSLSLRAPTVAFAAVTTILLACDSALAAAKGVPAQPAHGENTPVNLPSVDTGKADTVGSGAGGGSLVRTFVGLAIVIGVIYGLYWVLRQVKSSREERSTGTSLSSEAVVPLGPNRSLHLVRAGRELVLLGVAEHGVTPIRRYTEAEAADLGLFGGGDEEDGAPFTAAPAAATAKAGPMTIGDALAKLRAMTVRA